MIKGSIVALVTPFKEDGRVNFDKLSELVEFHIANGTKGLLVLGTTGESPTLEHEEQVAIVKHVIEKAAGRIHIMAGSGGNNTQKSIKTSQEFEKLGVDSLLVITPYYNKTNDTGIIKHFTSIADSVKTPIVLYNVPGRTSYSLSVSAVEELSKHENIIGIKEASGDISFAVSISHLLTDDFHLYSGNDDIIVPLMSLGASGVISVWANVTPATVAELVETFAENPKKSLQIQLENLDFIHSLFVETNPIPVKFAMNQLGMNVGPMRLPLDELTLANHEKVAKHLRGLSL